MSEKKEKRFFSKVVRITEEDLELLRRDAKGQGIKIATLLRRIILKHYGKEEKKV